MSPVTDMSPSADVLQVYRRQYLIFRDGKGYEDLAGSETSCMHGSFLRGNREALCPAYGDYAEFRMENPKGARP